MYASIKTLYKVFLESRSVFIDSRNVVESGLFFALKGSKFDGNDFIKLVLSKGAYAAVTDNLEMALSFPNQVFYVKDTIHTLRKLAVYHRNHFDLPVIAIAGSNGKTTTKELIAKVLSRKYKILFTQGNLNNHIGLPLNLLRLRKSHEIAVLEMGANHSGEIKMLCDITQPTYGYITNFGRAHLEGFGSEEGVVRAKSELYDYLREYKKTAFVCADDILQIQNSKGILRCLFSKNGGLGVKIGLLEDTCHGVSLFFKKTPIHTHLKGIHHFTNLSAVIAIADYFKIPVQQIKIALESYYPDNNRSEYFKKGSSYIFLDAYNANPSSMEAAIAHFERLKGTKIAILSDMLELGVYSDQEHLKIVERLQNTDITKIFLVGSLFSKVNIHQDRIKYFLDRQSFEDFFIKCPIPANHILIKGSRKFSLEKLIPFL